MTKLTDKQQAFVANKAAGVANREAAIAAGYAEGSADVAAHRLMQKPAIKAAIKSAANATPGADAPTMPKSSYGDPLDFLTDVMNHPQLPIAMRADAAFKMLPYKHARIGEVGKKQSKKERATELAAGTGGKVTRKHKFATKAPPPNLTVVRNE